MQIVLRRGFGPQPPFASHRRLVQFGHSHDPRCGGCVSPGVRRSQQQGRPRCRAGLSPKSLAALWFSVSHHKCRLRRGMSAEERAVFVPAAAWYAPSHVPPGPLLPVTGAGFTRAPTCRTPLRWRSAASGHVDPGFSSSLLLLMCPGFSGTIWSCDDRPKIGIQGRLARGFCARIGN